MASTVPSLRDRFRSISAREYRGPIVSVLALPLAAVDAPGGLFSWRNDLGSDCVVNRVTVDVREPSSGACTIDVGGADAGNVLASDLISGMDVAAAGALDSLAELGASTLTRVPVGGFVTGSVASGASAGLVATAYLQLFTL